MKSKILPLPIPGAIHLAIVLLALCLAATKDLPAQVPSTIAALNPPEAPADPLPDAPTPQTSASNPAPPFTSQSATPPQTPQLPNPPNPSRTATGDQQIKQQESQRVLGVLPQFNISYNSNAVSLTSKQKFSLAFHTVLDPVTIASAFVVAGYREALDDDIGFRWGPEGYLRRTGASYLDDFDSILIGNAVLPSVLHQDPRYFRLGHGTVLHRILYSAATNVICKHDNTGKWEPNYSNVLGNIAAGALSNLYYPSGTTGMGQTLTNGLVVTAEGAIGSLFDEFWPDLSRKFLHRDPTHGQGTQPSSPQPSPTPPIPPPPTSH